MTWRWLTAAKDLLPALAMLWKLVQPSSLFRGNTLAYSWCIALCWWWVWSDTHGAMNICSLIKSCVIDKYLYNICKLPLGILTSMGQETKDCTILFHIITTQNNNLDFQETRHTESTKSTPRDAPPVLRQLSRQGLQTFPVRTKLGNSGPIGGPQEDLHTLQRQRSGPQG